MQFDFSWQFQVFQNGERHWFYLFWMQKDGFTFTFPLLNLFPAGFFSYVTGSVASTIFFCRASFWDGCFPSLSFPSNSVFVFLLYSCMLKDMKTHCTHKDLLACPSWSSCIVSVSSSALKVSIGLTISFIHKAAGLCAGCITTATTRKAEHRFFKPAAQLTAKRPVCGFF